MKSRQKFIAPIIIFVFLCFTIWWVISVKQGRMPYIDQCTRSFVSMVAGTPVYTTFRWLTELGSKWFVQPLTIMMTIGLWIIYKDFRPAFIFGFGVLGTHILNNVIKEIVARERPSISALLNAEGYSFPSGHAMVSIVCYGLLAFFIGRKIHSRLGTKAIHLLFGIIIVLIGISRYIINVHYLTDVVTGYTIGLIILIYLIKFYKLVGKRKKKT